MRSGGERVRNERWGPRLIDIDVLTYGERTNPRGRSTFPIPAVGSAVFVLVPRAEIAPDAVIGGQRPLAQRVASADAPASSGRGPVDWWRSLRSRAGEP